MKPLLFFFLLAGVIGCGERAKTKAAHAGFNFNGSFITFSADSFPDAKWMIDSGEMTVSGDKDLALRRAVWMFDSVLDRKEQEKRLYDSLLNDCILDLARKDVNIKDNSGPLIINDNHGKQNIKF